MPVLHPSSSGASASSIFTSGIVLGNSYMRTPGRSRVALAFAYDEDFGTAGNGSPASRFLTSPARKPAKGAPLPFG
jgi:hypothetical protein